MQNRRNFLRKALMFSTTGLFPILPTHHFSDFLQSLTNQHDSSTDLTTNSEFWKNIRKEYDTSTGLINLNNGGVSPSPKVVLDAKNKLTEIINEAPSYYMWRVYSKNLSIVKNKLADLAGSSPDEIALTRNATESLTNIIFGIQLEKNDEIIMSNWDYPNMENSWNQRSKREGIVVKQAQLPPVSENDDEIVAAFEKLITPKTKAIHITHIINWTGQILPAKKLCALAKKHGIISIVDGAHSFNQLNFKISDIDCDYFGASLHKWLGAPIGTGFLYIRKDKISETWPLASAEHPDSPEIVKFENYGTHQMANKMAIVHAIDFMNLIGIERKETRLRYLKNYWINEVKDLEKVRVDTSIHPQYACAMAGFNIQGSDLNKLNYELFRNNGIHVTQYRKNGIEGTRVSPNVFTSTQELDVLIECIKKMAR